MEEIKPNEGQTPTPEHNENPAPDYHSLYQATLKAFEEYKNATTAKFDFLNSKVAQLEVQIENNKPNPNKPKNIIF